MIDFYGSDFSKNNKTPIVIDLDGTRGYGSSFLEEGFGGLLRMGVPYAIIKLFKDKRQMKSQELEDEIKDYIEDAYRSIKQGAAIVVEEHIPCAQYITWAIAIAGWLITLLVAWAVLRKNARNSWIGDIKKALIELEDESVTFWMGVNSNVDLLELKKLRRKIKDYSVSHGNKRIWRT